MEIAPHVSVDPGVHHGSAVITGTRVPVAVVVGSLAGGMSKAEVMGEYDLTNEQVEAALAYAARLVSENDVTALGGVA